MRHLVLFLLAALTCGGTFAAGGDPLDALAKSGARIERDAGRPGNPVVKISLRNTKTKDDDLKPLRGLKTLRSLDLSHTEIGNAGLAQLEDLSQLEDLNLAFTAVTDEGLTALRGMTSLKVLNLEKPCKGSYTPKTRFTDKAVVHLQALTRLESLNLDWNMFTDAGLADMAKMTSLREVILGYQTGVTSKGQALLRERLPKAKIH
ncbi:MAG: hypothetical protein U0793_22035 [Gemmataceae bacterium]